MQNNEFLNTHGNKRKENNYLNNAEMFAFSSIRNCSLGHKTKNKGLILSLTNYWVLHCFLSKIQQQIGELLGRLAL